MLLLITNPWKKVQSGISFFFFKKNIAPVQSGDLCFHDECTVMLLPFFYKSPRLTIIWIKRDRVNLCSQKNLDHFPWLCIWTGCGTAGVQHHQCWKLWECPVTHAALPFLAFQPSAHQPQLAEALVSVGEERGISLAESWPRPSTCYKTSEGPLVSGLDPWHSGFEGGEIPASFPLAALVPEEGKGLELMLVTGDEWAMQTRGLIASTSPLRPPPEMFFGQTKSQDSQKTQLTQSQEQFPPPCRHSPSPKAYPEDLVRKLKNSWVCGDKPCGFAL